MEEYYKETIDNENGALNDMDLNIDVLFPYIKAN